MDVSYPYICTSSRQVPEDALPHLDARLVTKVGSKFTELFPQFGESFPKASLVIEEGWTSPALALMKGMREWVGFIVVQRQHNNVFFPLQPEFADKEGELFDEDYEMLPQSWKELYRWFDSFCVTEKSYAPMDWWNTPFRFSGRLDLNDYEDGSGASRQQTESFARALGCERDDLRCFLLTENEDALFINEKACDGRVFHVNGKSVEKVIELPNPRESLDEYLEFFLAGGSPSWYQFV